MHCGLSIELCCNRLTALLHLFQRGAIDDLRQDKRFDLYSVTWSDALSPILKYHGQDSTACSNSISETH